MKATYETNAGSEPMGRTNKEVAAAYFAAVSKADLEGLGHVVHPELQVITTGASLMSGSRSHQDVVDAVGYFVKDGIFEFEILTMTAEEDRVSVEAKGRATMRDGRPYKNQYHFLMNFRDGKIIKITEYLCTKTADEGFGPLFAEMRASAKT